MVMILLLACTTGTVELEDSRDSATDSADSGDSADSADSGDSGGGAGDDTPPPMDATRALVRISLDLRGVRPTDEELAAVAADPAALDALVDGFLLDPRFEDRVLSLYSEVFLTLSDYYPVSPTQLGVDDEPGFHAAIGEEPLRMVAYIAANDLPWYELVTADWTMANELLADIWPLDYPRGGEGWLQVPYTDGRPAAGILTSNGMWWRYASTRSNAHRARANVVSRTLLCNDYLERPIEFDRNIDLTDGDAVADALANNPACVNCHVSLDPLASYFWGFWWYVEDSPVDMTRYHPERERLWEQYTGVEPGYYGEPGSSLYDLGQQIAADPRFPDCAVQTAYELLLRRDAELADLDRLTTHRAAFLSGGLTLRSLLRSVVTDPDYLAGEWTRSGAVTTKVVTPDLLASQIEDLTGYRWSFQGYDMLRTDSVGLRTLAGGADGFYVTRSSTSPHATMVLVQERLAQLAARYAVEQERATDPAARRLFTASDLRERPGDDDAAVVAQIQLLYRRVLSVEKAADDPDVLAAFALWTELSAQGTPTDAWTGVLTVLLRDPDFLLY